MACEVPVKHRIGKPVLPTITASTQLKDLVGPESWKILKVAGYSKENVEQWLKGESKEGFEKFKLFLKNSQGVNDFAERNIRLIQDFIHSYKDEHMKQNVLHVARENRSKISTRPSKKS